MKRGTVCTGSRGVVCERGELNIGASTMGFGDRLGMGGVGGCGREQLVGQWRREGIVCVYGERGGRGERGGGAGRIVACVKAAQSAGE